MAAERTVKKMTNQKDDSKELNTELELATAEKDKYAGEIKHLRQESDLMARKLKDCAEKIKDLSEMLLD